MTVSSLNVRIGADISGLQSKMKQVGKSVQDMGKKISDVGKTLSTRVTAPLAALGGASLKLYDTQIQAEKRLEAALKATGEEVKNNMADFKEFASGLQAITTVGDESTLQLLQVSKSMGLTNEQAKRSARNAIALSKAMGINEQSAIRYTAALEQGNSTMLARYLPTIRELDDDTERAAKAQELLANMFSAATSEAQNGLGPIRQLKNTLGDAMEGIGQAITEAFDLSNVAKKLQSRVQDFIKWFSNLSNESRRKIILITGAIAGIGPALVAIGVTVTALGATFAALTSPISLVIGAVAGLAAGITYLWDNWAAVKERISDITWWKNTIVDMLQFLIEYSPVSLFIKGINKLLSYLGRAEIPNVFESFSEDLEDLKGKTDDYEHQFDSFMTAINNGIASLTGLNVGNIFSLDGEDPASKIKTTSVEVAKVSQKTHEWAVNTRRVGTSGSSAMQLLQDNIGRTNGRMAVTNYLGQQLGTAFSQALVFSDKLLDSVKQIAKQLASKAIVNFISALIGGGVGGIFGGGFFKGIGKLIGVNDALITSAGDVVKFHPDDSILAMKDFSKLNTGGGKVEVFGTLKGQDIFISSDRSGKTYNR